MTWRRVTTLFVVLSLSGCLDLKPTSVIDKREPVFNISFSQSVDDIVNCLSLHFDDYKPGILGTSSYRYSVAPDGKSGRFILNAGASLVGVFEFDNQIATLKLANSKPFRPLMGNTYLVEDSQQCIR